jgi:hypothetical protein
MDPDKRVDADASSVIAIVQANPAQKLPRQIKYNVVPPQTAETVTYQCGLAGIQRGIHKLGAGQHSGRSIEKQLIVC